MQTPLLSRSAAAEYLGVKPQTLAVWFSTGRYPLPAIKVGRLVKYSLNDLQAFIQVNTHGHTGSQATGASA